jgi:hypothetical protein
VGDDSSQGYIVGSQWLNTLTLALYTCKDASVGAAVWVAFGAGFMVIAVSGWVDYPSVMNGTVVSENATIGGP